MISGASSVPNAETVRNHCETALRTMKNPKNSEIAFFGGSFTAINRQLMNELLNAASPYIRRGDFHGIRISTRPDHISHEILDILKNAGVTSIEIGAQSLDDEVLLMNLRGHTYSDITKACHMISLAGFELGLQIMPGIYGSTREKEVESISRILDIKPDTIRIYPISVLRGTLLEKLWNEKEYILRSFDDILEICAKMLLEFTSAGISVLRCGLHASDNISKNAVAGYYHPAFKELAEGLIYKRLLENLPVFEDEIKAYVAKGCLSKAIGHKKANVEYFLSKGIKLTILESENIKKYDVMPAVSCR